MCHLERKTFAVIGAGPKGIAVAVKAKVLEEFGFIVDRVILIEKQGVAAHWSGDFGYTNGEMKLGTPPEKDIVFPLETNVGNEALNTRIHQRLLHFTWTSFLVHTHRYTDWVDRGRHAPCHKLWALYLQWVAEQLAPEVSIVSEEVVQIDLTSDSKRWELTLQESTKNKRLIEADRLMLTGPGKPRVNFIRGNPGSLPPSTYDLESFWDAFKMKTFSTSGRLAIIGTGENAASALLALSQYAPHLQVDVISPRGFLFSRAENYYENQVFSQPEKNGWSTLEITDRLDFIKRTDLSVFSLHAMTILNEQIRHRIIPGRVVSLKHDGHAISLNLAYHQKTFTRIYDQAILATGFDQVATLKSLLTPMAQKVLVRALSAPLNQQIIASKIQPDLSVQDMQPYLHLPMLAGLMQGPGFANLSCLGLLSDRVMSHFARKQAKNLKEIIPYRLEAKR
ncbi:MAG: SidA/IucD/PvdA family monooxygenase [Gammaproteobacteria bacterium]|nr:SidA/IucD/PvdA family monooxygenase [Gammaproteobacteria bacterium]MCW5582371.1 SidA/IucD/PvdA family monooxygenase [Gammaproteobacteria bacterium]